MDERHHGPTVFALVSGSFGGGQQIALRVARALRERDVPIAACAPDDGVALERFRALGAVVMTMGAVRTHDRALVSQFGAWLRGLDARCLYTHTVPTHETVLGRAAVRSGVPLVMHRHSMAAWSGSTPKRVVQKALWRRVLARAASVPAVSQQVADQVRAFGGSPTIVPNGVPIPAESEAAPGRPPVVGFVGRFDPNKRAEDFIAMAAALATTHPLTRFLMVGLAPQWTPYERDCLRIVQRDAADHIEVRPFTTDVNSVMDEIDILVVPSVLEGHPLGVLEAMARQKAVVVADIPGCRETVTDGVDGRVFAAKDRAGLLAAVTQLIDDEEVRLRLGRAARATVIERFPEDAMLDRLVPLVN